MASDNPISIRIVTPGIQKHNRAQLVALSELQAELRAAGFDVELPPEDRAWAPTPDEALATVKIVELWIGAQAVRLVGKAFDDEINALLDMAKSWAKRQLAKRRKPDDLPRRTLKVIIYGPDDKPLKTIDVPDDSDDEQEQ